MVSFCHRKEGKEGGKKEGIEFLDGCFTKENFISLLKDSEICMAILKRNWYKQEYGYLTMYRYASCLYKTLTTKN